MESPSISSVPPFFRGRLTMAAAGVARAETPVVDRCWLDALDDECSHRICSVATSANGQRMWECPQSVDGALQGSERLQ